MRGSGKVVSARRNATGWLAGSLGVGGVLTILMISTIGSAGWASPSGFAGGSWSPTEFRETSGCSSARMSNVNFALSTGVGHWTGAAGSKTCPAWRSSSSGSYSEVEGALTVLAPVVLKATSTGVNVSWTFNYGLHDAAAATSTSCATTYYNSSYNYGYTWINSTDAYQSCYATASYYVYGYTYLIDETNGSYFFPSGYWAGLSNTSGTEIYNSTYSYTYSNSSYWPYNASYNYSYSQSYGAGQTVFGSATPSWNFTGSFVGTHKYAVETSVYGYAYTALNGFGGGAAGARVNLATSGHDMVLNPFVVW